MAYTDLREFIAFLEEHDEIQRVRGADSHLEIGGLTELMVHDGTSALLFEDIPDYSSDYRVMSAATATTFRWTAAVGLEPTRSKREAIIAEKDRDATKNPIPPTVVQDGPVRENVLEGDDIDVEVFPAPFWHEEDGGRFIGTGDAVISRHRETGDLNIGTYRAQVQGPKHISLHISPGKHGRINMESYHDVGEPFPVVLSVGHAPDMFLGAAEWVPESISEFEFIGARRGEPVEVIPGDVTDLPIPATAELVFEGHIYPDSDTVSEGPFGEYTGYYTGGALAEEEHEKLPITIERIYHRDEPIILGAPPVRPPAEEWKEIREAARLWAELEDSGIQGIKEVNAPAFGPTFFKVISIHQSYGGQAVQVGLHAASGRADGYQGRFTLIVDDDVDVFDEQELLWVMCTRCDPVDDVQILRNCWSTSLDPTISPERRKQNDFTNSRVIIDATRPYHWRDQFAKVNEFSDAYQHNLLDEWMDLFSEETVKFIQGKGETGQDEPDRSSAETIPMGD